MQGKVIKGVERERKSEAFKAATSHASSAFHQSGELTLSRLTHVITSSEGACVFARAHVLSRLHTSVNTPSRYFSMCVVSGREWVIFFFVCVCVCVCLCVTQAHQVDLIETSRWGKRRKTFSTRRRSALWISKNTIQWNGGGSVFALISRGFKTLPSWNSSVSSCLVRGKNFEGVPWSLEQKPWFVCGAGCSRGRGTNYWASASLQVRLKSWILMYEGNWPVVKPLSCISQLSIV